MGMPRLLSFLIFAGLMSILTPAPGRAQSDKTEPAPASRTKPAPEVDPDAPTYSTEKKYVPPGVLKSVEIGNFYLRKKKYKGALSRFQEAIQEDSSYAPAYLGLGKAYENIGLKQKALQAYKKYLDALPSEKSALEAKNAQRAVARLEREVSTPTPQHHGRKSRAQTAPEPQ